MILLEIRKKKRDEIQDIHQQENHFSLIFYFYFLNDGGASEIVFKKNDF